MQDALLHFKIVDFQDFFLKNVYYIGTWMPDSVSREWSNFLIWMGVIRCMSKLLIKLDKRGNGAISEMNGFFAWISLLIYVYPKMGIPV